MSKRIVLVLRSGGDFSFDDVHLISRHISNKWKGLERPEILCFYDKATREYHLGELNVIPLHTELPGTWARMLLYSPEFEKYKPFLYIDLDTAIINSVEYIFDLVKDESQFITLEDFWDKGRLATGVVWFPKSCEKVSRVWGKLNETGVGQPRMDVFLRKVVTPDAFWQQLTDSIIDFKPKTRQLLTELPENANLVCFHGKPRIFEAANKIEWVKNYIQ